MKKLIVFVFALIFVLSLTACKETTQEQPAVYSFYGKNECYEITNGTISLSDSADVFCGGTLRVNKPKSIKDITAYRATFYTMIEGQQVIIHIDELQNRSSTELSVIDFGKKVIHSPEISQQFKLIDKGDAKFWCELNVTDTEGNRNRYTIALELLKISG